MEKATFAGGCFWCTEAVFKRLTGVISVVPGYAGGEEHMNKFLLEQVVMLRQFKLSLIQGR